MLMGAKEDRSKQDEMMCSGAGIVPNVSGRRLLFSNDTGKSCHELPLLVCKSGR